MRAHQKGQAYDDDLETASPAAARRRGHASRPPAARYRRLPAHDRSALRRAREIDQGAGGGGEEREAHPPCHAEERRGRRSGNRRHLHDRHAGERAAAAQAARRHGEGAGRGRGPRQGAGVRPLRGLLRGDRRGAARRHSEPHRGGGARSLGRHRVRELREAQQEGLGRSGRGRGADRRLLKARRHDRLASGGEDHRQAGRARDHRCDQAPREGAGLHGERDLGAPGGKSASARASSARWRRPSASTTSTSR